MKKQDKRLAAVLCNGGSRRKEGLSHEALKGDCAQLLAQNEGGPFDCAYGCVGGLSCANVCPVHAVALNKKNVARVNRAVCTGCGACVKACPRNLIRLIPEENTLIPRCANPKSAADARKECDVSCIACGLCVKNCPTNAITIEGNRAVLHPERCISCGMCAVKCPQGVITDVDGIFATM